MGRVDGRSDRHINRSWAKSVGDGPFLLRALQQVLDVDLGCLSVGRRNPIALDNAYWMVAPESAFLRIDRDHRKSKSVYAAVRLDHHVLVQHRRRQILRAAGEHLPAEKSSRAAVMHHRLLDALYKMGSMGLFHVGDREAGRLTRGGIDFGKQGNQSTITVLRMRVTELELSPLRIAVSLPPFRIRR